MRLSRSEVVCILLMIVSQQARPEDTTKDALRSELKAVSETSGLALARIEGDRILIYPFGSPAQKRRLNTDFLLSCFDPHGLKIVGHRYQSPNSVATSRTPITVADNRGEVVLEMPGWINVTSLAMSPDGTRIALIGTNTETHAKGLQVALLQSSSSSSSSAIPIEDTSIKLGRDITWAPNSEELAFSKNNQVRVFNLKNRTSRILANGTKPSWSPDGAWIAFLSKNSRVVLHKISNGQEIMPDKDRKAASTAIWAPDSHWFFIAEPHRGTTSGRNCFIDERLVVYRVGDLAHVETVDPCDFKPELFGWISAWQEWGSK